MPDFLSFINEILWGSVMIYLLLGAGVWFTWRTKYIQFRYIRQFSKSLKKSLQPQPGGLTSFQALCLSLAACGSGGDTDTDTDAAPDSFEGMVKDSERMVSLSDYGGTWAGDDGSTMLVEAGGDGDEVRFALYDAGDEVPASGFIQFVPDYGCDYFSNEHDGVAYRSRLDEAGALDVVSLGTFAKVSGDLPGETIGDTGFETLAGTWYLDAEADAPSILVIDQTGGWELMERPGGDGDPTMVDCGTIRVERSGEETLYYAVSTRFADVTYDFTLIDSNTMYWGGEYDYYQKMA